MRPRAFILTLVGLLTLGMLITTPGVPGTTSCPQSGGRIENLLGLIVPVMACPGSADFSHSPLAAFTYERTCTTCGIPGFQILVNATWSSGALVLYTWNFGDGTPQVQATSPSVNHNYQSLGPNNAGFQVTLTVQDSAGLTNTFTQTVTPLAIPRFTFQPTNPPTGQPVTFNSSASQVYLNSNTTVAYSWTFGDGTSGTGLVVNHAYSAPGIYRVVLTFFNVYGSSQVSKTVNDPALLDGDVNLDCKVNIMDLTIVGGAFGSTPSSSRWNPAADLDHDGKIDLLDLAVVASNFGRTC